MVPHPMMPHPMMLLAQPKNYSAARVSSFARNGLNLDTVPVPLGGEEVTIAEVSVMTEAEFAALMQAYLRTALSPYRQDFTALIGQAGEQVSGIYEADYRDFNRETYARGRAAFDDR